MAIFQKKIYKFDPNEVQKYHDLEYKYGEQVDNLMILVSTGTIVLLINAVYQYKVVPPCSLKWSLILITATIILSFLNRLFTFCKTHVNLKKMKVSQTGIIHSREIFSLLELISFVLAILTFVLGLILAIVSVLKII